jgi:hypothetical protein
MNFAQFSLFLTVALTAVPSLASTKVIANDRAPIAVDACAKRGWCETKMHGQKVMAIAEIADERGVSGVCLRGDAAAVAHVTKAIGGISHQTRSGAVCVYRNARDVPANPAVSAEGYPSR